MLIRTIALVVLFTGLSTAFADEIGPCELSSMTLEKNLDLECTELTVAPGTVIDTQGFDVNISVHGSADLGSGAGLTLDSRGTPGVINVYVGLTLTGQLNIRNEDSSSGLGGDVTIIAGSAMNYDQSILNGLSTPLVEVGGIQLNLEGRENSIAGL